MREIVGQTGRHGTVVPRRVGDVEMKANRVVESREGAIVEERRRDGEVAQRGRAELVAVGAIAGRLLEPEILVLARALEDHVALADAERRRDLRHADDVLFEVAEHLVRVAIGL